MNRLFTILLLFFLYISHCFGCDEICTSCLLSTSHLMTSYQCNYRKFTLDECVQFINNQLGSIICGTIYQDEILSYLDQQCFNKIPIPMLSRNIAVGICYSLCK